MRHGTQKFDRKGGSWTCCTKYKSCDNINPSEKKIATEAHARERSIFASSNNFEARGKQGKKKQRKTYGVG